MKNAIRILALPVLFLLAGWVHAMSFPSVENLRFEGTTLVWNAVPGAGGYNIYYLPNGPSKDADREYLTTVRNGTSFSDAQPGVYSVVAFNQDSSQYSAWASTTTIWLRSDGTVDVNTGNQDGTTVTFYGPDNTRFLVETNCSGPTGICSASCNESPDDSENSQTTGYVTGGFCSSSASHLNSSGSTDQYSCYSPNAVSDSIMTAGAYCSK